MKNNQSGLVLWLTGLSGSGKTTLADKLLDYFKSRQIDCERLDGDIFRRSLTADLDFSPEARNKNIELAGQLAKELSERGKLVVASFISPYLEQRKKLRKGINNFIEVYLNCPLDECERRDVKGLYKKARAGELRQFTGIDDVYEPPQKPEIELKTNELSPEECFKQVIDYLESNQLLNL